MDWLLIAALLLVAFGIGRLSKPTIVHWTREGQHESAYNEGYLRGRLGAFGPSLDDMNLALHRQEGLLGAVNDNYHDLQLAAKKLNGEHDKPKAN